MSQKLYGSRNIMEVENNENGSTPTDSQELTEFMANLDNSELNISMEVSDTSTLSNGSTQQQQQNGRHVNLVHGASGGITNQLLDSAFLNSGARSISPGNVSQYSLDSCHSAENPEEKGELDVNVKVMGDESASSTLTRTSSLIQSESKMPCYEMSAKPRGVALIIEVEEYVNNVHERRIGSKHDVSNLEKLWTQLHFEVRVERNPDYNKIHTILDDFSADEVHKKANMMILTILSHGHDGHVYTADGRIVPTEKIYEKFNNARCPNLKGKPKFFIIQACRGEDIDKSYSMKPSDETLSASKVAKKRRAGTDTTPFNSSEAEIERARPTWEDMIIAYSTIPGYASIRDHDKGTWFIQSLVEVFMNHSFNTELIDLLRMTSEYLSRFTNEFQEKQTCNVEFRHLYKKIYFNPGRLHKSHVPSPQTLRRSLSTPPSTPVNRSMSGDQENSF